MQRRMGCTLRFETVPAISMHHIDALRDAISHFALCTCIRQALTHGVSPIPRMSRHSTKICLSESYTSMNRLFFFGSQWVPTIRVLRLRKFQLFRCKTSDLSMSNVEYPSLQCNTTVAPKVATQRTKVRLHIQ